MQTNNGRPNAFKSKLKLEVVKVILQMRLKKEHYSGETFILLLMCELGYSKRIWNNYLNLRELFTIVFSSCYFKNESFLFMWRFFTKHSSIKQIDSLNFTQAVSPDLTFVYMKHSLQNLHRLQGEMPHYRFHYTK